MSQCVNKINKFVNFVENESFLRGSVEINDITVNKMSNRLKKHIGKTNVL